MSTRASCGRDSMSSCLFVQILHTVSSVEREDSKRRTLLAVGPFALWSEWKNSDFSRRNIIRTVYVLYCKRTISYLVYVCTFFFRSTAVSIYILQMGFLGLCTVCERNVYLNTEKNGAWNRVTIFDFAESCVFVFLSTYKFYARLNLINDDENPSEN